jgi:hypothetical protein
MSRSSPAKLAAMAALVLVVALSTACKSGQPQQQEDEAPTEAQTVTTDALPGPFEVAQEWVESPTFDGLPDEVEARAKSWKAGQVARLYAVTEGYHALVHNYTTARDAPAVVLTIAKDASGRWKVVDARLARTTHMWPEM